jgi:hypothetical protein
MRLSFVLLLALQSALVAQTATTLTVPIGTTVELTLTRPLFSYSTIAGSTFYAQTDEPVLVPGGTAIPSGTYVEGSIAAVTPPSRSSRLTVLHLSFNTLIFANNYVVELASPTLPSIMSMVLIKETTANDLFLDNGDKVSMTTASPLAIDASQVAQALPLSVAPNPKQFHSATLCVPDPGSPDTTTPGTPGTPGTPDTYIPGTDGNPGTTIPGIPATPGTPGTTIPGTPATYCPVPPVILSSTPELTITSPVLPPSSNSKKKKKKT